MKKGYTVTLSLRYITEVEIETEEEDEAEIMETAAIDFVDSMRGTGDADDIIGEIEAVKIELMRKENIKTFIVSLNCRSVIIDHYVNAKTEEEAVEHLEDDLTLEFTSEDGTTDCQVSHFDIDYVEETNFKMET